MSLADLNPISDLSTDFQWQYQKVLNYFENHKIHFPYASNKNRVYNIHNSNLLLPWSLFFNQLAHAIVKEIQIASKLYKDQDF